MRVALCKPLALLGLALLALVAACSDPVTIRLKVDQEQVELARGESVTVTATYERNGVPGPVGDEASWSSDLPSIAAVTAGPDGTAVITAFGIGATQVTVKALGLQKVVRVNVLAPGFTAITVDPPATNLPAGLQVQLRATARLEDGSQQNVSGQATWSSAQESVATVDATGEVTAHASGTAIITAELGDVMGFATVTVTGARLTSVVVAPANPQVPRGSTQQMTATGTFTDGSMRDVTFMMQWSSSLPAVASITPAALVTAEQNGTTTIAAQLGSVLGTTSLTVVAPALTSIDVLPANPTVAAGRSQCFSARGHYSNGAIADVSAMVTWSSSMMNLATISNAAADRGCATTLAMGTTVIRATVGAIVGQTNLNVGAPVLDTIRVAPAGPLVPLGRTQAFTATGVYSDGSMLDLTPLVTWASTLQGVATISNAAGSKGVATSVALGNTTISATSGAVSGIATMVVTSPIVELLRVEPADGSLAIGASRQLHAVGMYSDGVTREVAAGVSWSSSLPARATISAAGLATGVALGPTTITASIAAGGVQPAVMGSTTLTVTPVELASITLAPIDPSVLAGSTQQFVATGHDTDGSTTDLTTTATWSSSAPAVATVSATGLATTLAGGTTTISATRGAISGSTLLTAQATTVIAFSPAEGATAVRPTTAVAFTFSQAMDVSSLAGQLQAGACTGNLQLSADHFATCLPFTGTTPTLSGGNRVATLQPAVALRALQPYELRALASARATTGVPMAADVTMATPFTIASDGECAAALVISQVYAGGGDSGGASWRNDFIELHNPGPTPVALDGLALQYASAGGTVWTVQALPALSVPAGGYVLVREGGGGNLAPPALPAADLTPAAPIDLAAGAGKVALTPTTTALTGGCPLAATLDLVGYGAAASCAEGAPTAELSDTLAAVRAAGGCTDRNAAGDLAVAPPAPRNGASPPSVCVCWANETELEAEVDYCNLQFPDTVTGMAPFTIDAVYGRTYEAGVTEEPGPSAKVRMAIGAGPSNSDPHGWPWFAATFNVSAGNDDEYRAPLLFTVAGDYRYTSRATRDGTNWTLCDLDGAGSNPGLMFDPFNIGRATVTP
jgi:uncharacterized protein YjdB